MYRPGRLANGTKQVRDKIGDFLIWDQVVQDGPTPEHFFCDFYLPILLYIINVLNKKYIAYIAETILSFFNSTLESFKHLKTL